VENPGEKNYLIPLDYTVTPPLCVLTVYVKWTHPEIQDLFDERL